MDALTEYFRIKSQKDEQIAWLGQLCAGLRRREQGSGAGDLQMVIEYLRTQQRREVASESLAISDEVIGWLSHIDESQQAVYARVQSFSELLEARPDPAAYDAAGLAELVHETLTGLPAAAAREHGRVRIDAMPLLRVRLDPLLFRKLLGELLVNALRFSPESSTVELQCRVANHSLQLELSNRCLPGSRVFEALQAREDSRFGEPFAGSYDSPRFELAGHDLSVGLNFASALARRLGGDLQLRQSMDFQHGDRRYTASLMLPFAAAVFREPVASETTSESGQQLYSGRLRDLSIQRLATISANKS